MNTYLRIVLISALLLATNIFGQSKGIIKGTVVAESDKSPLIGVNVFIQKLSIGAATDDKGFFEINNLDSGIYIVRFSSIGYRTLYKKVDLNESSSINLNIEMQQSTINLKEVTVTGNPFLIDPKDISQTTVTLSKLDLLVKQGGTVAQTLNFQPGISMRSNGIATGRPVIRGFSNNMVLIIENGLRMGDLSSASGDHGVSNNGSEPEKIEVIEGPSSLLYGSNAIGGVVNIISDAIPSVVQKGLNGFVLGGLSSVNNEFLGNIHLNYGINKFALHGTYSKRKGEDYNAGGGIKTFNSDVDTYSAEFGASYHPNWGAVGLSYNNYHNIYGLPAIPNADEVTYINMRKEEYRFLTDIKNINSFITSLNLKAGYLNYHHDEISRIDGSIGTSFGLKTFTADLSFNHKPLFKNSDSRTK